MRLILKLVLPGLSNAEVCGGEVIGKASILAPGAGRRRRGRFFAESIDSLVQSLLVNGLHATWQGLVGKSFASIYDIAKESQRRHLRPILWL